MVRILVGVYYLFLSIIAVQLYSNGAGIVALLIFLYPTVVLITYHVLSKRMMKFRTERQNAEREYEAGWNIVGMVLSNDGPGFSADIFDCLDADCEKLGIQLHCDMRGYFE